MSATSLNEFIVEIASGKSMYRSYWHKSDPVAFAKTPLNAPWRFTPFVDKNKPKGPLIQGLYIGDSPQGCLAETIFRKDKSSVVNIAEVDDRNIVQVKLNRKIQTVALTSEFFQTYGIAVNPIMDNDYVVCSEVASTIHSLNSKIAGLSFPSYQSEGANHNVMLFSDRIDKGDIKAMRNSAKPVLSNYYRSDLLMASNNAHRELSQVVKDYVSGKVAYKRKS